MRRSRLRILSTVVLVLFMGSLVAPVVEAATAQATPGRAQILLKIPGTAEIIDLNTATKAQLMQIPGIGEQTATRLIASRNARGSVGFKSIQDFVHLKNVGPAKIAALEGARVTQGTTGRFWLESNGRRVDINNPNQSYVAKRLAEAFPHNSDVNALMRVRTGGPITSNADLAARLKQIGYQGPLVGTSRPPLDGAAQTTSPRASSTTIAAPRTPVELFDTVRGAQNSVQTYNALRDAGVSEALAKEIARARTQGSFKSAADLTLRVQSLKGATGSQQIQPDTKQAAVQSQIKASRARIDEFARVSRDITTKNPVSSRGYNEALSNLRRLKYEIGRELMNEATLKGAPKKTVTQDPAWRDITRRIETLEQNQKAFTQRQAVSGRKAQLTKELTQLERSFTNLKKSAPQTQAGYARTVKSLQNTYAETLGRVVERSHLDGKSLSKAQIRNHPQLKAIEQQLKTVEGRQAEFLKAQQRTRTEARSKPAPPKPVAKPAPKPSAPRASSSVQGGSSSPSVQSYDARVTELRGQFERLMTQAQAKNPGRFQNSRDVWNAARNSGGRGELGEIYRVAREIQSTRAARAELQKMSTPEARAAKQDAAALRARVKELQSSQARASQPPRPAPTAKAAATKAPAAPTASTAKAPARDSGVTARASQTTAQQAPKAPVQPSVRSPWLNKVMGQTSPQAPVSPTNQALLDGLAGRQTVSSGGRDILQGHRMSDARSATTPAPGSKFVNQLLGTLKGTTSPQAGPAPSSPRASTMQPSVTPKVPAQNLFDGVLKSWKTANPQTRSVDVLQGHRVADGRASSGGNTLTRLLTERQSQQAPATTSRASQTQAPPPMNDAASLSRQITDLQSRSAQIKSQIKVSNPGMTERAIYEASRKTNATGRFLELRQVDNKIHDLRAARNHVTKIARAKTPPKSQASPQPSVARAKPAATPTPQQQAQPAPRVSFWDYLMGRGGRTAQTQPAPSARTVATKAPTAPKAPAAPTGTAARAPAPTAPTAPAPTGTAARAPAPTAPTAPAPTGTAARAPAPTAPKAPAAPTGTAARAPAPTAPTAPAAPTGTAARAPAPTAPKAPAAPTGTVARAPAPTAPTAPAPTGTVARTPAPPTAPAARGQVTHTQTARASQTSGSPTAQPSQSSPAAARPATQPLYPTPRASEVTTLDARINNIRTESNALAQNILKTGNYRSLYDVVQASRQPGATAELARLNQMRTELQTLRTQRTDVTQQARTQANDTARTETVRATEAARIKTNPDVAQAQAQVKTLKANLLKTAQDAVAQGRYSNVREALRAPEFRAKSQELSAMDRALKAKAADGQAPRAPGETTTRASTPADASPALRAAEAQAVQLRAKIQQLESGGSPGGVRGLFSRFTKGSQLKSAKAELTRLETDIGKMRGDPAYLQQRNKELATKNPAQAKLISSIRTELAKPDLKPAYRAELQKRLDRLESTPGRSFTQSAMQIVAISIGTNVVMNVYRQLKDDGSVDWGQATGFLTDSSFWMSTAGVAVGAFVGSKAAMLPFYYLLSTKVAAITPFGGLVMSLVPAFFGGALGGQIMGGNLANLDWVMMVGQTLGSVIGTALAMTLFPGAGLLGNLAGAMIGGFLAEKLITMLRGPQSIASERGEGDPGEALEPLPPATTRASGISDFSQADVDQTFTAMQEAYQRFIQAENAGQFGEAAHAFSEYVQMKRRLDGMRVGSADAVAQ